MSTVALSRLQLRERALAARVIAPKYRAELREDPDFPAAAMEVAAEVEFAQVPSALAPDWLQAFGKDAIRFDASELSILFDYGANGIATHANVYIEGARVYVALDELGTARDPKWVCETIQTGKGGVAHFWVQR